MIHETTFDNAVTSSPLLQQLNDGLAGVVDSVRQSLVQVSVGVGNGAGTLWHSDGLIVTNAHVVGAAEMMRQHEDYRGRRGLRAFDGSASTLTVTLPDGSTMPAQLIAQDNERDLAALSIDAHDLPSIQPGDSRQLHAGQWVFAIGHPWGVLGAASAGVVIGAGSEWPDMPTNGRDWVITSLKVRPGNSGGPLVDTQGRLVGVNTLMTGPGIGAAVPVQTIKHFLKDALGERTAAAVTHDTRVV